MKIYNNILDFDKIQKSTVLMGTFDGVHRGHVKVIQDFVSFSEKEDTENVLITFDPHPMKIIYPNKKIKILNTLQEKVDLLQNRGIDNLIIHPFSLEFSKLNYEEFICDFILKKIMLKQMVIGYDHKFGKDKEGDFEKLKQLSKKYNFKIERTEVLQDKNDYISSTAIRNVINEGNMTLANKYLGYDFFITGKVIKGYGVGKKLGFPTANIFVDEDKILPKNGVYYVIIVIDSREFEGVMNIGVKPTLKQNLKKSTEVHILNFHEDIYDKILVIRIKERIRDEREFSDLEELKKQISKDISTVKKMYNE